MGSGTVRMARPTLRGSDSDRAPRDDCQLGFGGLAVGGAYGGAEPRELFGVANPVVTATLRDSTSATVSSITEYTIRDTDSIFLVSFDSPRHRT
jgi:hypothetical protein